LFLAYFISPFGKRTHKSRRACTHHARNVEGTAVGIRLRDYVAMSALLVARLAAGWLLGGPGSDNRKALALTTSLRNVGVGRDRQLRRHDGRHCCPGLWDLRDCWIVAAGPGLRPSESFSSVMSIHLVGIGIVRLWFSWFRSLAIRYG